MEQKKFWRKFVCTILLLVMPQVAVPGCAGCVHWYSAGSGASERLVVSPGREGNGILHMPGGQSGHPLSPHYSDQQQAWVEGTPLPLETGTSVHRLELIPVPDPASLPASYRFRESDTASVLATITEFFRDLSEKMNSRSWSREGRSKI